MLRVSGQGARGFSEHVTNFVVSPAGHLIASCGMNSTVLLWESPHPGLGIMAGPNSTAVPSSGSGGSGGGAMTSLQGMTGAVNDVAFTCDGFQVRD